METLWYILLFGFKFVFIGLIYFVLFILLRTVLYEMASQANSTPQSSGALGRLEVVNSGQTNDRKLSQGSVLNLQAETTLGADPTKNNLFLDEPTISGRHARMSWDGHDWWIEDLDSSNGTRVNGKDCRSGSKQPVPVGTRLRLGDMEFRLLE